MNSCLGRQQAAPGMRAARALAPACRVGQLLTARPVLRNRALAGSSPHNHGAVSLGSEASALPEPEIRADGSASPAAAATETAAAAEAVVGGSAAAAANGAAAAAADDAAAASEQLAQEPQQQQQPAKKGSNFINRVIFGIILGFGGAAVVFAGQIPYLCAALFVVYQATQEFYGMLTSKGISKGTPPPTPFVSAATTALCLSITAFTFVSQGRSGAAMSVAAFILLAMNILVNRKPTFAQLTASVFGLFYCGERQVDCAAWGDNCPAVSKAKCAARFTCWLCTILACTTALQCMVNYLQTHHPLVPASKLLNLLTDVAAGVVSCAVLQATCPVSG